MLAKICSNGYAQSNPLVEYRFIFTFCFLTITLCKNFFRLTFDTWCMSMNFLHKLSDTFHRYQAISLNSVQVLQFPFIRERGINYTSVKFSRRSRECLWWNHFAHHIIFNDKSDVYISFSARSVASSFCLLLNTFIAFSLL